MIVYRFGRDDLLRTRFALSPLTETVHALRLLARPDAYPLHAPWARGVRERLRDLDLDLALLLATRGPGGYSVDFVAPPPSSPRPALGDELDRVREADPGQVARELSLRFDGAAVLPGAAQGLMTSPRAGLHALASTLESFWERALRPIWPRVLTLLEDDVARRAVALTRAGGEAAFAELHPAARFAAAELRVESTYAATVDLAGAGLLLMPSAFGGPRPVCYVDPPWQPAVLYPARGVGMLWAGEPPTSGAVAALIGRRRAHILGALGRAATTSELSSRLALPTSSVSEHLSVLRDAGLVRARRDGREVRYARTPLGDELAARAGAG